MNSSEDIIKMIRTEAANLSPSQRTVRAERLKGLPIIRMDARIPPRELWLVDLVSGIVLSKVTNIVDP